MASPGPAADGNSGRERELEREGAGVAWDLIKGALTPEEAAAAHQQVCQERGQGLHGAAFDSSRSAGRRAALRRAAEDLKVEAATWALLGALIEEQRALESQPHAASREGAPLKGSPLPRSLTLLHWLEGIIGAGGDAPPAQRGLRREEQVLQEMWRSLPSGLASDALAACNLCGHLWHAGPLNARGPDWPDFLVDGYRRSMQDLDVDVDPDEHWQEALADEVEMGGARRHTLWLQGCWKASAQCKEFDGPANAWEAAIYGALCGCVPLVLQVCGTNWEHTAWTVLRAWCSFQMHGLDLDSGEPPGPKARPGHHLCARAGQPEGKPDWPWQQLSHIFSQDFNGICELLGTWGASTERPTPQLHHTVQMLLASDQFDQMLTYLKDRILEEQLKDADRAGGPEALRREATSSDSGELRFAANIALWLVHEKEQYLQWTQAHSFSDQANVINKVLQIYVIHLIDKMQHDAIPVYASNLRDTMLDLVYCIYLDELLKEPVGREQVRAYQLASELLGDVTRTIALKVVDKAHRLVSEDLREQLLHKSRACEWICKCGLLEAGHQYTLIFAKEVIMRGRECHQVGLDLLARIPYSDSSDALNLELHSATVAELRMWQRWLECETHLWAALDQHEALYERRGAQGGVSGGGLGAMQAVTAERIQAAFRLIDHFLEAILHAGEVEGERSELHLAVRVAAVPDEMDTGPAAPGLDALALRLQRAAEVLVDNPQELKAAVVPLADAANGGSVGVVQLAKEVHASHTGIFAMSQVAAAAVKTRANGAFTTAPEYADANPGILLDVTVLQLCIPRALAVILQIRNLAASLGLPDPCGWTLQHVVGASGGERGGGTTDPSVFLTAAEMGGLVATEAELLIEGLP